MSLSSALPSIIINENGDNNKKSSSNMKSSSSSSSSRRHPRRKQEKQQHHHRIMNPPPRTISTDEALSILLQCDQEIQSIDRFLEEPRHMSSKAGLCAYSDLPDLLRSNNNNNNNNNSNNNAGTATRQNNMNELGLIEASLGTNSRNTHGNGNIPNGNSAGGASSSAAAASITTTTTTTTGGHSNTDHVILCTHHYATDRIAELRRNVLSRHRSEQPESRGMDRWDKPRIPGERRRRIIREKDLPGAPPDGPISGYIIFVGQMTTKIRHDRPNERHSQTRVVQEISKAWRIALSDEDRKYYNDFAYITRCECRKQHMEYRATGQYTTSDIYERIDGVHLWTHKKWSDKNTLEREIANYDTVIFPPRPPEYDEQYERNVLESKRKRKLKLQGCILDNDGNIIKGTPLLPPLPPIMDPITGKMKRRRRTKKMISTTTADPSNTMTTTTTNPATAAAAAAATKGDNNTGTVVEKVVDCLLLKKKQQQSVVAKKKLSSSSSNSNSNQTEDVTTTNTPTDEAVN